MKYEKNKLYNLKDMTLVLDLLQHLQIINIKLLLVLNIKLLQHIHQLIQVIN